MPPADQTIGQRLGQAGFGDIDLVCQHQCQRFRKRSGDFCSHWCGALPGFVVFFAGSKGYIKKVLSAACPGNGVFHIPPCH